MLKKSHILSRIFSHIFAYLHIFRIIFVAPPLHIPPPPPRTRHHIYPPPPSAPRNHRKEMCGRKAQGCNPLRGLELGAHGSQRTKFQAPTAADQQHQPNEHPLQSTYADQHHSLYTTAVKSQVPNPKWPAPPPPQASSYSTCPRFQKKLWPLQEEPGIRPPSKWVMF